MKQGLSVPLKMDSMKMPGLGNDLLKLLKIHVPPWLREFIPHAHGTAQITPISRFDLKKQGIIEGPGGFQRIYFIDPIIYHAENKIQIGFFMHWIR